MKKVLLFVISILIGTALFSQNAVSDSVICWSKYSVYKEYEKLKIYDRALPAWREMFNDCPQTTRGLYIDGIKIYKFYMDKETDQKKLELYLDTIGDIYDKRIKYFGEPANVYGRKGIDIAKYTKDLNKIQLAYESLEKSIDLDQNNSDAAVLVSLFNCSMQLNSAGKASNDLVIDNYIKISDIFEFVIKNEKDSKKKETVEKLILVIDDMFIKFANGQCEKIVPYFEKKMLERPDDIDLLKKITKIIPGIKCEDSQVYIKAAEALYKFEPSAFAAFSLARYFVKKEQYAKSVEYYNEAISKETNDSLKAQYYYEAALIANKRNQDGLARSNAYKALELRPNYGSPYILIATLYANSYNNCGADNFEKATVYWLAVDKLIKAKAVDPSVTDDANRLISTYTSRFPNKEDAFMHGITQGNQISIGCWINETTTARF